LKIATGREMAAIDRRTIKELGVPGAVLMENAARASCRALVEYLDEGEKPSFAVLCGSGNNGGDGFCIARILSGWGFPVTPVHIGRTQSLKPDAGLNYNLLKSYGLDIVSITGDADMEKLAEVVGGSTWIIDAIFGTGLSRQVLGIAGKTLKYCSGLSKKVMAVDIPSGINSDTGEILGEVIPADLTVTFGLPKWGHFIFPGAQFIGQLKVADIGFPPEMLRDDSIRGNLTTADYVRVHLPQRKLNAHKGSCGRLAVVGGSRHFIGAAILTSKAALRTGVGYVTLFTSNYMEPHIKSSIPDVVTFGLTDMDGGFITTQASDTVLDAIPANDALAIGPGLGRMSTTRDFVIDVLEENTIPVVIDADGLNNLCEYEDLKRNPQVPWIMTPHPGEAARLLGKSTKEVLVDPISAALSLVERYKAVVVLKGANSIIMDTDGKTFINPTGNPGMATMGTGDVLTGIISSLLAQGVPAFQAAVAGVYIHGLAGDTSASGIGEESIIASDLITHIPPALRMIREGKVTKKIKFLR